MTSGSEAVLYDIFGDPMAVEVDAAIPAGTAVLVGGGSDGTNARYIKVDSSGNQIIIGLGTAGSPAGGVVSIQGVASGTVVPISGTITANAGSGNFSVVQATAANLNATVIGTVTSNIGTTGGLALDTTLAKLTIAPGTAIGSNTLAMVGGHVTTVSPTYTNGNINQLSLTTAGALRIDGSGVIQPVSSTQLPPALVGSRLDINIGSWLSSTAPTVGQKTMANSIPITLASDQSSLPITLVPATGFTGLVVGTVKLGGSTAGTAQVVRATTYNEQTTDAQRSISSSSASDTSAGVGARTVEITYYDQTCAGPFTETLTLNGTTAVATANSNICFIEKMTVKTVGSTERNVGTITLFVNNSGGGGTIGTIGIGNYIATQGDNRTFWGHHYVADGYTAKLATLVASATVSGSVATATFILRAKDPTISSVADVQVGEFLALSAAVVRALGIPIELTGPARVTAFGSPSGNNAQLFASFDFSETI